MSGHWLPPYWVGDMPDGVACCNCGEAPVHIDVAVCHSDALIHDAFDASVQLDFLRVRRDVPRQVGDSLGA